MQRATDHFNFNVKDILIDEIALEGLQGIGIESLWRRVEVRINSQVTEKMKNRFWNILVNCQCISFFETLEPVPVIEVKDRFYIVDSDSGHLLDPEDYLDGPFKFCPVENEYGSCSDYNTRQQITNDELQQMHYNEVISRYVDHLVLVATKEERWRALASHLPISLMEQLTPPQYGILELVGRGRENGQVTVGKTHLLDIHKDPKLLFYIRNVLKNFGLIKMVDTISIIGNKSSKNILLRLKRFHKPIALTGPKTGRMYELMQYLLKQPNYRESTDVIVKKGILTYEHFKRLVKITTTKVFEFETLPYNENEKKPKRITRFVSLVSNDDSCDDGDDEDNMSPATRRCEYKVHINLLRQAYEQILEAGSKGLTQYEIGHILGVEFYTSRSICKMLTQKKIIREVLEDKGRQRIIRYIGVVRTGYFDNQYEAEKKRLLQYIDSTSNCETSEAVTTENTTVDSVTDDKPPAKRIKLETSEKDKGTTTLYVELNNYGLKCEVEEIVTFESLKKYGNESLLSLKKHPTLRQLKFANGIAKIVREKNCVSGLHAFSSLVSKEINEPPMDSRSFKLILQRLVTDKQLKIYKIKWPLSSTHTLMFCSPDIKSNDPIIVTKCKEISIRILTKMDVKPKTASDNSIVKSFSKYIYPRYMKIQKLHEFLTSYVYFNEDSPYVSASKRQFPHGVVSVAECLPEMTVQLALGNIAYTSLQQVKNISFINEDLLHVKLVDSPIEIFHSLLQSKSLQSALRLNLKILTMLGLIQLISLTSPSETDYNSPLMSYAFYINRHAKIIDTTGNWPRETENAGCLEKSFHFKTFADVKHFWKTVYSTSVKTNVIRPTSKQRIVLAPPLRSLSEVEALDNGNGRLGNGLGPCGFDSNFFMEVPRFWDASHNRSLTKKLLSKTVKRSLNSKKKTKKPVQKKKVSKPLEKIIMVQNKFRRSTRSRDPKTVSWTDAEDYIITLGKVALIAMCPIASTRFIRVRNQVIKTLVNEIDPHKTTNNCHKRASTLDHHSNHVHQKERLLSEIRQRPKILNKYINIMKVIRNKFAVNFSKQISEAQVPLMELMWIMHEISKSKNITDKVPCIAANMDEFYKKYNLTTPMKSYVLYQQIKDTSDRIENALIKETIIMDLMHAYNSNLTQKIAKQIFNTLKPFSEVSIRKAMEHLQKSYSIAIKEKTIGQTSHKINYHSRFQSTYKISVCYQRKLICRLNSDFVESLTYVLLNKPSEVGLKGNPEINCVLFEFYASDILEINSITIPSIVDSAGCSVINDRCISAQTLDLKCKLKSGTLAYKVKQPINTFAEVFEDIKCEELFKTMQRNAVIKSLTAESVDNEIISYLKEKCEIGSSFDELKEHLKCNDEDLITELTKLEEANVIKRVGMYRNVVVLLEYCKHYATSVDDHYLIPSPWRSFATGVRIDMFLKWAGAIVNKVIENPGSSISNLCNNEFLAYRNCHEICVFLKECEVLELKVVNLEKVGLFTEDDEPEISDAHNVYASFDDVLVFPLKNTFTKFTFVRNKLLQYHILNKVK